MQRRALLLLSALAPLGTTTATMAQSNIRPDPTLRLPPQPGQTLPADDLQFLRNAALLSTAQAEAAAALTTRGSSLDKTRTLATQLAERHRRLAGELTRLTQHLNAAQPINALSPPQGRVADALQKLATTKQNASDPAGFLRTQLEVHPVLIEICQIQASNSTNRDLNSSAITSMVGLQEDFSEVARIGARYQLAPPARMLSNPPQYGPGAGLTR